MEWNNEETISLISEFEKRPLLWDHLDVNNKNNYKKREQIKEIARIFNCSELEIDRKWKIIKGQLKRELNKIKSNKLSGSGNDDSYRAKWFAFPHLSYLWKNKMHNSILNMETSTKLKDQTNDTNQANSDRSSPDILDENSLQELASEQFQYNSTNQSNKQLRSHKLKRKFNIDDPRVAEAFSMLSKTKRKPERDHIDIYGECFVSKLRQIEDSKTRLMLQRDVDNLLYDALMGIGRYARETPRTEMNESFTESHATQSTYITTELLGPSSQQYTTTKLENNIHC